MGHNNKSTGDEAQRMEMFRRLQSEMPKFFDSPLASEVAALRAEIAALRQELKPVSTLILTGAAVLDEFKRLHGKDQPK